MVNTVVYHRYGLVDSEGGDEGLPYLIGAGSHNSQEAGEVPVGVWLMTLSSLIIMVWMSEIG